MPGKPLYQGFSCFCGAMQRIGNMLLDIGCPRQKPAISKNVTAELNQDLSHKSVPIVQRFHLSRKYRKAASRMEYRFHHSLRLFYFSISHSTFEPSLKRNTTLS